MSTDSSKHKEERRAHDYHWYKVILLPLWVLVSFALAQLLVVALLQVIMSLGVPIDSMDEAVQSSLMAAMVYTLSLMIAISGPLVLGKSAASKRELGVHKPLTWVDLGLAPAAFVSYFILSAAILFVFTHFVTWFDIEQVQETGFGLLTSRFDYLLAFATLVVIAPIAEEILFRGYLYGKLRKAVPIWLAILVTSALFGLVHGQWNVAIDTFALSLVMCGLREVTGTVWAGTLLHMLKNGVAFFMLFVMPQLGGTIGL